MAAEAGQPRVPTDLLQDKQDRPTGGELLPIARHDLDRAPRLLTELRRHRWTWTVLVGYSPKLFFVVMSPDPGDSPPSEISATIPDEPVPLLHVDCHTIPDNSACYIEGNGS